MATKIAIGGKRNWHCSECQTKATYVEEYDMYACQNCNLWLEVKCSDKNCEYCSKRSEKPF